MTPERMEEAQQAVQALSVIQRQSDADIQTLAIQLGYDGDFSISSLEDGIRFYQAQTVETCIALGVRLLLLKKQAGHGEFQVRAELLGFKPDKAQRFMQAAQKVSKNPNLRLLAGRVNSFSAFAEIIFENDVVLENLAELDDFDRMPASELRLVIRGMKDSQAKDEATLVGKDKEIRALGRRLDKQEAAKATFTAIELRDYEATGLHGLLRESMVWSQKLEQEIGRLCETDITTELLRDECVHAVALCMQRLEELNGNYRLGLSVASVMGELDTSGIELRATGMQGVQS